nr:hypothetical protein [uncultured Cetobacterium sp.]
MKILNINCRENNDICLKISKELSEKLKRFDMKIESISLETQKDSMKVKIKKNKIK